MKIQSCQFQPKRGGAWHNGFAFMAVGFDFCDVYFIVDIEGKKIAEPHNYRLKTGPLQYIDTELGHLL